MDIQCCSSDANNFGNPNAIVTNSHIWKYIPSVSIQVT